MKKNKKRNSNSNLNSLALKTLTNNQAKLVYDFIDNCDKKSYHFTSEECNVIPEALLIFGNRHSDFDSKKHTAIAEEKIIQYCDKTNIALIACAKLMNELLMLDAFIDSEEIVELINKEFLFEIAVESTDEFIEMQKN